MWSIRWRTTPAADLPWRIRVWGWVMSRRVHAQHRNAVCAHDGSIPLCIGCSFTFEGYHPWA